MSSYLLPSIYRYLAGHSEVQITTASGVTVALGLVLGLAVRETMRVLGRSEAATRVLVRRFNVVLVPVAVIAAVTVVERFRLIR